MWCEGEETVSSGGTQLEEHRRQRIVLLGGCRVRRCGVTVRNRRLTSSLVRLPLTDSSLIRRREWRNRRANPTNHLRSTNRQHSATTHNDTREYLVSSSLASTKNEKAARTLQRNCSTHDSLETTSSDRSMSIPRRMVHIRA